MGKKTKISLIIVGLFLSGFALLSYTVTQSTRSCGGTRPPPPTIANLIMQFPTSLRTGTIRMILGGVKVEDLKFNPPLEFSLKEKKEHYIFHPEGGKVIYQKTLPKFMENNEFGKWVFNGELEINNFDNSKMQGESEITAFLIGVKKETCSEINKLEKIKDIPQLRSDQSSLYSKNMITTDTQNYILPKNHVPTLDNPEFSSKHSGCFQSFDGKNYVAYSVILER